MSDTGLPSFGTNTLAGGNFWWVGQGDDAKGHNVFSDNPDEGLLEGAPGRSWGTGCGTDSCHNNLHATYVDGYTGLADRQGCTGCHMVSDTDGPKGFHHADDSDTVVDTADEGWYRFLQGHQGGNLNGVAGIEHEKWNYGATASNHNEYLGNETSLDSTTAFGGLGNTMTAFCCGCHGDFHMQNEQSDGSGRWLRHPSDVRIPNSGEYAFAFGADGSSGTGTYDPMLPVARPTSGGTFDWNDADSMVYLGEGEDMVMCLSCHVAHGSPYDDMLRWNYKDDMIAGGGGADGTGCFICHTSKDGQ